MHNNLNKTIKKTAFTLVEILIAITITSIIMVLATASTMNSTKMNDRKIAIQSQSFYDVLSSGYFKIASSGDFKITSGSEEDLLFKLGGYLKLTSLDINCSELKINDLTPVKCAKTANGAKLGVAIDKTCNTSIDTYEYLKDEDIDKPMSERIVKNVKNACGFIIYTPKKSQKIFKQDAFVIPLKKRNLV